MFVCLCVVENAYAWSGEREIMSRQRAIAQFIVAFFSLHSPCRVGARWLYSGEPVRYAALTRTHCVCLCGASHCGFIHAERC